MIKCEEDETLTILRAGDSGVPLAHRYYWYCVSLRVNAPKTKTLVERTNWQIARSSAYFIDFEFVFFERKMLGTVEKVTKT